MDKCVFVECIGEALYLLEKYQGQGRVTAGGTNLMMVSGRAQPDYRYLVNISRIGPLQHIIYENNVISIGAAVPHHEVGTAPLIQDKASALATAARSVGSQQIRSVGTVVGNVVTAHPAADTAVVLMALGADAIIATGSGSVQVPVENMYADSGRSTVDSTCQLVTQVQFHGCLPGQGTGFARLSGRKVSALPVLSVAAMVSLANAAVEWARIVMAPVGPRPVRAPEAEQFLVGKTPDTATIATAGQMAVADAVASAPRSSRPRTVSVLPALVERALTMAVAEARQKR